jgi:hypothetical protein
MNAADFDTQFNRLTGHFHLPADSNRDLIALDWLKAVEHYHVDALDHAVTDLIRTAQDRFWPSLGKVLTIIRGRIGSMEKTGACATCHGSSWIESAPFKANHMIYEGVCIRCPDCGIPAPQYSAPGHRHALTAAEYADWRRGDHERQYMPECLQAKPRPEGEVTEIKAAMERLRIKLFGTFDENNGGVA